MTKILLLTVFLTSAVLVAPAQTAGVWIEDYEAMKRFMAEGYANLEWARDGKRIDLAELDKKTTAKLKTASTAAEYRKILDAFLETFQDGHLRLGDTGPESNSEEPVAFAPDAEAKTVCNGLGYRFKFHKFSLPFHEETGFKNISSAGDHFPAGVIALKDGRKYGVLDISLFSPTGFWQNCIDSWKEFSSRLDTPCEGECLGRFHYQTADRLSRALSRQLSDLESLKLDGLVLDIGGNGGGSNWVEPAARQISPKPLRGLRLGFIRHPHWVSIVESRRRSVLEDLARKDLTPRQAELLRIAKALLDKQLEEAKAACDLSKVWTGEAVRGRGCTMLSKTPGFASGVFERISVDEISELSSKSILFQPSEYQFEESVFKGRLIVLVDKHTASAAEMFASYIKVSGSGQVVGEKTLGAGCGYVNGGTKYSLPNSKLRLYMPDCVRYRKDGVNEVEGIEPDVVLFEAADSGTTKLGKLLRFLSEGR